MANVASYAENAMLNWVNNATAVTRPTTWQVGLSLGSPTTISGSEITTGVGYTRQSVTFAAATNGTASNANAITFGTFNTAMSISGIQIWDTLLTLNSGNLLWYGLLSAARTVASGDSLVIAAGALVTTLS